MNKQYRVDEEGNVKVIKENHEVINHGKCNKHTKEILSLENYSKEIQNKIDYVLKELIDKSNKFYKKNKFNKNINITITIVMTLFIIFSLIIDITAFILMIISIIPISLIVRVTENELLKNDREKIKYYDQKYKELNHTLKKIKTKIETLKQDKTRIIGDNNYIEVPPIENYNLDSNDYFIEKYRIDRRVKEMTKDKPKKLIRKNNINNLYKI